MPGQRHQPVQPGHKQETSPAHPHMKPQESTQTSNSKAILTASTKSDHRGRPRAGEAKRGNKQGHSRPTSSQPVCLRKIQQGTHNKEAKQAQRLTQLFGTPGQAQAADGFSCDHSNAQQSCKSAAARRTTRAQVRAASYSCNQRRRGASISSCRDSSRWQAL